jgi:hypothetical protein
LLIFNFNELSFFVAKRLEKKKNKEGKKALACCHHLFCSKTIEEGHGLLILPFLQQNH